MPINKFFCVRIFPAYGAFQASTTPKKPIKSRPFLTLLGRRVGYFIKNEVTKWRKKTLSKKNNNVFHAR